MRALKLANLGIGAVIQASSIQESSLEKASIPMR